MLYCEACRRVVAEGQNMCSYCGNGFVSRLVCGKCARPVAQGTSACSCEPTIADTSLSIVLPGIRDSLPLLPTALTTFDLPPPIPDVYRAGKFGVRAVVQMNGRDAEILTRMGNAAVLLLALANEMNGLQGHMASTRACIKAARNMASDLQEEIEIRIGPQG